MARAKRHYITGHVWHITHRCHKREFLFKFSRDRRRWLQWLFEARKRYRLMVLNYIVTSNHIHLLVVDDGNREVIPKSLQLVAGRTGQEYNQRKNRGGAFWEDRYHATAIESGEHLLRCMVYVDLNMVRADAVHHPSEWIFSGYNEIQKPRRKCALIAYERLLELTGFDSYDKFRATYNAWIDESLGDGKNVRNSIWTQSIAVGGNEYIERTKEELGILAKGRKVMKRGKVFQLREEESSYNINFGIKNNDIGGENSYFWNSNLDISI